MTLLGKKRIRATWIHPSQLLGRMQELEGVISSVNETLKSVHFKIDKKLEVINNKLLSLQQTDPIDIEKTQLSDAKYLGKNAKYIVAHEFFGETANRTKKYAKKFEKNLLTFTHQKTDRYEERTSNQDSSKTLQVN